MNFKFALVVLLVISLLPLQASAAGCGRWVVRDNTDYLADPAFDAAIDDGTVAQAAQVDLTSAQNESDIESSGEVSATATAASEPQPLDVSGSWSFSLNQSRLDLILIQSGDRVQGYGNLDDHGQKNPLTAMGTVSDENLSLEVKMVSGDPDKKVDQKYSMDLAISNQALSGVYESYLNGNLVETGDAVASKS